MRPVFPDYLSVSYDYAKNDTLIWVFNDIIIYFKSDEIHEIIRRIS